MMTIGQALAAEMQMEGAGTRKILERTPLENGTWKPHEHSMSLARLASHIADIPEWVQRVLHSEEFDFAAHSFTPFVAETTSALLLFFDKALSEAEAALHASHDDVFSNIWTMRRGEHVIFARPRLAVLRHFAFSHLYHHRGQLSVYLRLLNIPVPGMYGPSFDDRNETARLGSQPV